MVTGHWKKEVAQKIIKKAALQVEAGKITEEKARDDVFKALEQIESSLDAESWPSFIEHVQELDQILVEHPDHTFLVGHGTAIEEYLKFKGFVQLARDWQKTGDHRPCIIVKAQITKSSHNGFSKFIIDSIKNEEILDRKP